MISDFFQPIRLIRDNKRLRAKIAELKEEAAAVSEAYHQVANDAVRLKVEVKILRSEVVKLKAQESFVKAGKKPIHYISAPRQQKIKKEIGYVSYDKYPAKDRPKELCNKCEFMERRKESDALQGRTFCLENEIQCGKFGSCNKFTRKEKV